jgi:hypothetical protein
MDEATLDLTRGIGISKIDWEIEEAVMSRSPVFYMRILMRPISGSLARGPENIR